MQTFFETQGRKLKLTHRSIAESLPTKADGRFLTPAAVGNWWRGESSPPLEYADDLARLYHVTRQKMLEEIHKLSVAIAERKKSDLVSSK